MSHNAMKFFTSGFLAVVGLAASAQATFYSAASDSNDKSYTFVGSAASEGAFHISDSGKGNAFNLLIDDDNHAQPSVSIATHFQADLTATPIGITPINASLSIFNYAVSGSFSYVDAVTGNTLLTCTIGANAPAIMSIAGIGMSWSSSGGVFGADSFANVTYTISQDLLDAMNAGGHTPADYGLSLGSTIGPDDFAFSMTALTSGILPVQLDQRGMPTTEWGSEGSYSGSSFSNPLPAPSACALAGLGGLVVSRRRRA